MKKYISELKIKRCDNNIIQKLEDIINSVDGTYYIRQSIDGSFRFPYLLYVPRKIKKNKLILHGNNLAYEEGNCLNVGAAVMETTINAGYPLTDLCMPILVPITSNYIHPADNNGREFFPMQASRNVIFCKDKGNTYYHLFDQINAMIDDAKKYIYEKKNIALQEKVIAHGFSSSAKFVLRYATCYPSKVSLLIAGGFGAQCFIPLKTLPKCGKEIPLPYPIGVYDMKEITGKEFDNTSFMKMKQFYFMGELEDNSNDTAFNNRHTDVVIQNLYRKIFGEDIHTRLNFEKQLLKDMGYHNIEIKVYPDFGHSATPAIKKTTQLIEEC